MTGEFMANDVTPALICHAQLLLRYAKQWELEVNGRTWAERFVLLRKRRYSAIKSISTNGVEE
ncbi:MAG TPA: hypothetical protein VHZ95_09840 [Polyangiales bacterium]|nr:hypothetical protein [Polyangiales bacterium]